MRRNVKIFLATIGIIVCLFFLYNLILLGEIVEDQPEPKASKVHLKKPVERLHVPSPHHEDTKRPTRKEIPREEKIETKHVVKTSKRGIVNLSRYNTSILILTHKRDQYLVQVLNAISELPEVNSIKNIIISQDGTDEGVRLVIERFSQISSVPVIHQIHQQKAHTNSIFKIADHYGWALGQAFETHHSEFVITVEDDIIPSYDFLSYFDQLSPYLLDAEEKVWCISSWNDLGFKHLNLNPSKVYRTQFFPGLGWMMHRNVWMDEFRHTWPNQAWDYFMRTSHIHRHRDCICPELPRNTNIGVTGVTVKGSGTYERLLKKIAFQSDNRIIPLDLENISIQKYDQQIRNYIEHGKILPLNTKMSDQIIRSNPGVDTFVIPFEYRSGLQQIIGSLGITYHNEERTHHEHVMIIPYRIGIRIILINAKLSKFIPSSHKISPPETFQEVAAEKSDESCDVVCQRRNMKCNEYNFDWIMNCDTLKKHFPCEKGCMIETGREIPSYVVNQNDMNFKKCILLTQDHPQCKATHRNTQRLCPCH